MGALRWPAEWERTRGLYVPRRRRLRVYEPPRGVIGVSGSVTRGDLVGLTATTTITRPAGAGPSHVLVAVFANDTNSASGTSPTTTAPAGWTAIFPSFEVVDATPNHIRLHGFWALGSVTNLGFTNTGNLGLQQGWVCVAFTGVDLTTPMDATGTTNSSTGASSLTTNAVTVATDGAWHLIAFCSWLGGTNSASGFSVVQNVAVPPASNADCTLLYNLVPKAAGSTGTVAVSSTGGTTGQILAGAPFALRPAPPSTRLYIRETYRPRPFGPGFGR